MQRLSARTNTKLIERGHTIFVLQTMDINFNIFSFGQLSVLDNYKSLSLDKQIICFEVLKAVIIKIVDFCAVTANSFVRGY
jgi:hypothetical protein